MTHTIFQSKIFSEYKTTTPTGLYEANYRRLNRLVPQLKELSVNAMHPLPHSYVTIKILEQYKYTSVIALKQSLHINTSNKELSDFQAKIPLNSIDMELRICHDACLAEVIGYQGKSPIQSASVYPNKHMLQIDEKRQLNLFLKDVLEHSLKAHS